MGWIKNTAGKPDAMLIFAFISFSVVTLSIFFSTLGQITIGSFSQNFQAMEATTMTAYLGATFSAYVTRRWTEKRYKAEDAAEKLEE